MVFGVLTRSVSSCTSCISTSLSLLELLALSVSAMARWYDGYQDVNFQRSNKNVKTSVVNTNRN